MENYNLQQKIAIAVFAIIGSIIFGILLILLTGSFSFSNLKAVLLPTLIFGLFMGVVFPFILKKMTPLLEKKVKTPKLFENENIISEGKANLFRNWWIATGGKIFLTNKRLIFNAHKYNFQKGETSIELQDISSIQERKTANLVDNGLRIETTDNSRYDFVVNHRSQWIERLSNS